MKTCSLMECEKRHVALGYCDMHYRRFLKHGDPTMNLRKPWSEEEDDIIKKYYLAEGRLMVDRLSNINTRTYAAIRRRASTLGLATDYIKHGRDYYTIAKCASCQGDVEVHVNSKAKKNYCDSLLCQKIQTFVNRERGQGKLARYLYLKWGEQGGKCGLCGKPLKLIPGTHANRRAARMLENRMASIGHIVPRIRGGKEIDNLRWEHFACNIGKNHLKDDELVEWCKDVISTLTHTTL